MIEWIHYTQRRKPRQTGKWGAAAPEAEKGECSEYSLHERGKKAELFHELCFSTFENYAIIRTFHKDRRAKPEGREETKEKTAMDKIRRNERMSAMIKLLSDTPNRMYTLNDFCARFGSAKSTISEDIDALRQVVKQFDLGEVETVTGAAGGVLYRPRISRAGALAYIRSLCERLSGSERVLPGDFLYYSDILSTPQIVNRMGEIIATEYYGENPDFVLTMETKGIPVAFATANALGVPLVIARHTSRVYEGSAVNINYVSGSGHIETMSLNRRAVKENQRALIVDDFLRGGGTARGMVDLMREFNVSVIGTAFVMATVNPVKKRVSGEKALMTLEVREGDPAQAVVRPAEWLMG